MYKVPENFTLEDSRAYGRIANKNAPQDDTDKTELNANWPMAIFDGILNGDFRQRIKRWTTSTRPTTAPDGGELGIGEVGINIDTGAIEIYIGNEKWKLILGAWSEGEQETEGIAEGSIMFNKTAGHLEVFDGESWNPLGV